MLERRVLKLFYLLTRSSGYLKAKELAALLQVSERTVKSDLEELKGFVKINCGCHLVSVRGKGYILHVDEVPTLQTVKEQMAILFGTLEKGVSEKQIFAICRAIMLQQAARPNGYFRLEDLAESLYLSFSFLKKKTHQVRAFFQSFSLSLVAQPKAGLKLVGTEFNQRLCLLELYDNHFRTKVMFDRDAKFEALFADAGDRDQVRKLVLNILRASEQELYDTYSNRLIDYLILMRNRVGQGCQVSLEPAVTRELMQTQEYQVAAKIIAALEQEGRGFTFGAGEKAGLTLGLLLWSDYALLPSLSTRYPAYYQQALQELQLLRTALTKTWNFDFAGEQPCLQDYLLPTMLRLLLQLRYGYAQCRVVGNAISNNAIKQSPLALALARSAARQLESRFHQSLSEYNVQLLAVCFYGYLDQLTYTYHKRRLIICSRNGNEGAKIIASALKRKLGSWWIKRLELTDLYEARKFPIADFDYLLGSFNTYAYRYAWPYIEVNQILTRDDCQQIRNLVLPGGYDLENVALKCRWEVSRVHKAFAAGSLKAALHLWAYQWGKDFAAKENLAKLLLAAPGYDVYNQVLSVFVPTSYTDKQILELYLLQKNLEWQGESVKALLFVAVDFQEDREVLRFVEQATGYLVCKFPELEKELSEDNLVTLLTGVIMHNL